VDDILITGSNIESIKSLKQFLHTRFRIKDLGDLKFFLGIEIARLKKKHLHFPAQICFGNYQRQWILGC
jgi:hypothetical protein